MISTRWPAWASLTSSNPFLAFRWVQQTVSLFFVVLVVIILMRMMVAIMTCDCDDWWWWLCYWFIIYVIIIIIFNNILPVFKVAEEESSRGRTKLSCNARRSNLLPLLLITFGVGVEYSVITFQELKAAKIYWWLTINQAKEHLLKRMFGMPASSEEHCISIRAHIILDDKKNFGSSPQKKPWTSDMATKVLEPKPRQNPNCPDGSRGVRSSPPRIGALDGSVWSWNPKVHLLKAN